MKKSFFLIILVLALFSYAQEITVLHSGDTVLGDSTLFNIAISDLKKDFPKVKVLLNKIDLSDGSSLSMDAQIAAGTPPNVYIDTMVRASKYMIPEYAYPLNGKVRDLSKYNKGILDPYTFNKSLRQLKYS